MTRSAYLQIVLPAALIVGLGGCSSFLEVSDTSGASYAQLRGTVTRADGTPVANATIGVSCVGSSPDPFGLTTDADGSGRFDLPVTAPAGFTPLEGNTRLCRVLTPLTGAPLASVTVTVPFSGDVSSRPVTQVTLVVP